MSNMSSCFAVIDISRDEPKCYELAGQVFSIDSEQTKLFFIKDEETGKWMVSLSEADVAKEAMLFIDNIYQRKEKTLEGVVIEDGNCVELHAKNEFLVQGVFFEPTSSVNQHSPLLNAPDEILRAIVDRMDRHEAVSKLLLVCTRLFDFARTGLWWETVNLPLPRTPEASDVRDCCSRVCSGARKLIIKIGDPEHSQNLLDQVQLHQWENLEHLEITRKLAPLCSGGHVDRLVTSTCLAAFSSLRIDPRRLVTLNLRYNELKLEIFKDFEFPKLKCLRVRVLSWSEETEPERFFRGLPSLEVLEGSLRPGDKLEDPVRFFHKAPEKWRLKKLSFFCSSRNLQDFTEAAHHGKFANVTDLQLNGAACSNLVQLPMVTRVSFLVHFQEQLPTIPAVYPAVTHLTVCWTEPPADFSWESTTCFAGSDEWFGRLVSVNVYPALGFPFHRLSAVQFLTVTNDDGWHRKDIAVGSERFLGIGGHLGKLTNIRGLFLHNAIDPEVDFLLGVDWDLEYLALTAPLSCQLFGKIVERFPRLKFLQIAECDWKMVAKLRHLVCLLVGGKGLVEGLELPSMPPADGFDEFIATKSESLGFVQFHGYHLYCPSGVTDFRSYLGRDKEDVVDAMDFSIFAATPI